MTGGLRQEMQWRLLYKHTVCFIFSLWQHRTIPALRLKHRFGERGAADAKPKAQIILDAAKVSAASGGNSEPKQGQRSQSARGFCPRSTMRVPQPDIIEHFGNADAVPQLPERCLSRKAGIVRCCPIIIKTQKQYNSHNGQARCGCCFWCPFSRGKKSVPIYFDCIVDTAIIMPPWQINKTFFIPQILPKSGLIPRFFGIRQRPKKFNRRLFTIIFIA